ncbi:hypothetical protein H2248_011802 [Termitomyces sp. 'cryptogamus']|nr:hypothetical protein H2248_011802 [Termitomyces sp. 'cryptogamus']
MPPALTTAHINAGTINNADSAGGSYFDMSPAAALQASGNAKFILSINGMASAAVSQDQQTNPEAIVGSDICIAYAGPQQTDSNQTASKDQQANADSANNLAHAWHQLLHPKTNRLSQKPSQAVTRIDANDVDADDEGPSDNNDEDGPAVDADDVDADVEGPSDDNGDDGLGIDADDADADDDDDEGPADDDDEGPSNNDDDSSGVGANNKGDEKQPPDDSKEDSKKRRG